MDIVEPAKRSLMMRGVRRRDTAAELLVHQALSEFGLRFTTHVKTLPGSPDIVLPRLRTCIFVHGCFWHRHEGCRRTTTPSTRTEFWLDKFSRNKRRDRRAADALRRAGWSVHTIWECQAERPQQLAGRLNRLRTSTNKTDSMARTRRK